MKKNLQGLIAIPAVILFVTTVIPLVIALIVSIKDYSPFAGLFGSKIAPDGGLFYYFSFLSSPFFFRLLLNSLLHGFIPIITASLISFGLVYCLLNIPSRAVRYSLLGLTALAAFTPVSIFTMGTMELLTVNSRLSAVAFSVLNALPMVFIGSMMGVVVCEKIGSSVKNMMYTIGFVAILWAVTLFSSHTEAILTAYMPQNYAYMDVFQAYAYRAGVSEGNFPLSATIDMMLAILQLFLAVGAFFGLSAILHKLFKPMGAQTIIEKTDTNGKSIAAIGLGAIAVLLILVPVLAALLQPLTEGMPSSEIARDYGWGLFRSVVLMGLSAVIFVPVTLLLAYALHGGNRIWRGLLLALMACGATIMGRFLAMKFYGLLDSTFGLALFGAISVFSVFLSYLWVEVKARGKILQFGQYCRQALIPLLAVTIMHLSTAYGSYFWQMICLRSINKLGFPVILRKLYQDQNLSMYFGIKETVSPILPMAAMVIPVLLAVGIAIALYFDGREKPAKTVAPTYYSYMQ